MSKRFLSSVLSVVLAVSFVEEVLVPFPPHPTNDAASTTESTDDKKRLLIIFPPDE